MSASESLPEEVVTRRRLRIIVVFAFALAAAAAHAACAPYSFAGADYVRCEFDASRDDIRLYWRNTDKQPFGGFQTLGAFSRRQGPHAALRNERRHV